MTKKVALFAIIVACVAALIALGFMEQEAAPPPLPDSGGMPPGHASSGGDNSGGGLKAPDFSLRDLDGNLVTLSRLRGNVVVINFWSSHCPPCIMEMPSFAKLEAKMAGRPFKLLTITTDDRKLAARTMNNMGLSLTALIDADARVTQSYGVMVSPMTYIIDTEGNIDNQIMGAADWGDASVVDYLEALLKKAEKSDEGEAENAGGQAGEGQGDEGAGDEGAGDN